MTAMTIFPIKNPCYKAHNTKITRKSINFAEDLVDIHCPIDTLFLFIGLTVNAFAQRHKK